MNSCHSFVKENGALYFLKLNKLEVVAAYSCLGRYLGGLPVGSDMGERLQVQR